MVSIGGSKGCNRKQRRIDVFCLKQRLFFSEADRVFHDAWRSESSIVSVEGLMNTCSKVYHSPKLAKSESQNTPRSNQRQEIQQRGCYKDHQYREEQGTSITKNFPNDSTDEFIETLRTAVRCLNDSKKYFEKVLRNSIEKLGTDEDALTRVIVTRAEKDLKEIKELYHKRNNVALDIAVDKETGGDYKDMLRTLLGNEV